MSSLVGLEHPISIEPSLYGMRSMIARIAQGGKRQERAVERAGKA